MSVTVWGAATGPNQPAAHYNRWGQLTDAHSYRTFNPELPAGGINVDCDHDGVKVGTLVYAEIAPDERVRCVAVIDDGERLLELDQPLYWSATLDMRGCSGDIVYVADEARIIGLSLTLTPATVSAQPLAMQRGDLRDRTTRYSRWPSSWRTEAPLLERAVDDLPRSLELRHAATRIVDRRISEAQRERMYYAHPGSLRHSGHAGCIISVR